MSAVGCVQQTLTSLTCQGGRSSFCGPDWTPVISIGGVTLDIQGLGEADVTGFMVVRCAEQSCRPAQLTATALRSLLNFLHVMGAVTRSHAAGREV